MLARARGAAGTMAGRNAARNPKRTALTASALAVGLALLYMVCVGSAFVCHVGLLPPMQAPLLVEENPGAQVGHPQQSLPAPAVKHEAAFTPVHPHSWPYVVLSTEASHSAPSMAFVAESSQKPELPQLNV